MAQSILVEKKTSLFMIGYLFTMVISTGFIYKFLFIVSFPKQSLDKVDVKRRLSLDQSLDYIFHILLEETTM